MLQANQKVKVIKSMNKRERALIRWEKVVYRVTDLFCLFAFFLALDCET